MEAWVEAIRAKREGNCSVIGEGAVFNLRLKLGDTLLFVVEIASQSKVDSAHSRVMLWMIP